jgi:hypothetical protein
MSFLSTLFSGGDSIKAIGDTVDNLFTSDEERIEKKNEMLKSNREFDFQENKLIAAQNIAQTEVNKVEAASSSLFVAGWRPAIGWVGAIALFYQFIAYPLLLWLPIDPPPQIDSSQLYPIIMGMLGIAGMRSYDKAKGTDTKSIG